MFMEKRYKLLVTNRHLYKEVEVGEQSGPVKIGTTPSCGVRLSKEQFFEHFELTVLPRNGRWFIECSDNMFIMADDVRKLLVKELRHGDRLTIKYKTTGNDLLDLTFMVDFEYENKNYERLIDISAHSQITIGADLNSHIVLTGDYIDRDHINLTGTPKGLQLTAGHSQFGVFHNGIQVSGTVLVREYDFFSIANFSFYYAHGCLYASKFDSLLFNGISYKDTRSQGSALQYPKFNRSTRIQSEIPTDPVAILDPPQKEEKPKSNFVMSLMPALGMLVVTVLLRGVMSTSGGSFVIFSVCTMGIGIVTSIISFVSEGRAYKKNVVNRKKKYLEYIEKKKLEINQVRERERFILDEMYLDLDRDTSLVKDFSGDLFSRLPGDKDFLHVYIGRGAVPAKREIDYKKQEKFETNDELAELPARVSEEYKNIYGAPVVVPLTQNNAVGVIGEREHLYGVLKNMTLDICVRHYYKDVKVFYIIGDAETERFKWVRFLPHVQNDDADIRNIACDDPSATAIFEYLYNELVRRTDSKVVFPHWVIFVYNERGIKNHPVSKFLEQAAKLCVTFVFFETSQELLPQHCDEIVLLSDRENAVLLSSADKSKAASLIYRIVDDEVAKSVVHKLAPVYCDEVSLESALTKNISLYELLGIYAVDDLNLQTRWAQSQVYKSMAAPLGVRSGNEMVALDLHEKYHGPHGLVAGTTGSGKSEILQSYILSMATLFHPYEVSFVIIDFKGGGMVNQFKDLPHLNGAITDIDGHEINRSLLSIKAELDKRKALFSENKVNHIDKYIEKFKNGEVTHPLPHLILIVDEFAELKQDQPEFMNELISAARVGRSLGVHLILATQKPSGVVSEQIWSNSKFKLCLKVQDASDSKQVIKSPLAAEIKEPGRAYLQVGNNEIFELFQSAYSGAPAERIDPAAQREYALYELSLWGQRKQVYQKKKKKMEKSKTQLEVIVEYVHAFCENNGIAPLPGICLPSLPDVVYCPYEQFKKHPVECVIPVGLYDDPSRQYQGMTTMNLSQDNVFLLGSSLSGKTTLIQTMIRSLAELYTPREVNIYILDFASKILKNFSDLNHVGGVVTDSDHELLKSFIRMLSTEIIMRKNELSRLKLSSFISYRESGYTDLPQIVVFIDNFTALKEFAPEYEEDLLTFTREGVSVGISLVVSNLQTSGFGYKYLSGFSKRVAFYCNDSGQYGSLFDRCRMQPANVPGRAITEIDMTLYEFQTYLSFEGKIEKERVERMEQYISEINKKYGDDRAKAIPVVPKRLDMQFVQREYGYPQAEYDVPIALDYGTVDLVTLNLLKSNTLAILGKEKSGRTNLVRVVMDYLEARAAEMPSRVYIIDDFDGQLKHFENYSNVHKYTVLASDFPAILGEISEELSERYNAVVSGGPSMLRGKPLILVLVQNNDAIAQASADKKSMDAYKNILKQFKALKVAFIFTNLENANPAFSSPEILRELKTARYALYFDNLKNMKMFDSIPMATMREFKNPIQLGDAFFINEGDVVKVKTIHASDNR